LLIDWSNQSVGKKKRTITSEQDTEETSKSANKKAKTGKCILASASPIYSNWI